MYVSLVLNYNFLAGTVESFVSSIVNSSVNLQRHVRPLCTSHSRSTLSSISAKATSAVQGKFLGPSSKIKMLILSY